MKNSAIRTIVSLGFLITLSACQAFRAGDSSLNSSLNNNPGGGTPPAKCDTQVTVSWTPPTSNTDNTPLTDLAGFRIYYGTATHTYPQMIDIADPAIKSKLITNMAASTYYISGTAYAIRGGAVVESDYSNEAAIQLVACTNNVFDAMTGKIVAVLPAVPAVDDGSVATSALNTELSR